MGGGDLNLKKSWHPSTFQNLEKVWKAEHKHDTERKKIEQLQQEIKEERAREDMQRIAQDSGVIRKRDERVDWMYSGPSSSVNRDEYLLGKRIDKLVDPVLAEVEREKQELESGPGALFVGAAAANTPADLSVKVREDPLFLIKKKEEEARKLIASNPIKLKQLQQVVAAKKHKKHKSHTHDSKEQRRHHRDHTGHQDRKSTHGHNDREDHAHHEKDHAHKESRTQEAADHTHRDRYHHAHHGSSGAGHSERRRGVASSRRGRGTAPSSSSTRREEMERKREQMMADARSHKVDREKRLRDYEEEDLASEKRRKPSKDFVQEMKVKCLTSSKSLEDRIHRNIHSVQRTSAALSSDFLSRK